MKIDTQGVRRFARYCLVGIGTFILDLGLLYCLVHFGKVPYLAGTSISFLIAISLNYYISRQIVFPQSETKHTQGYTRFIGYACGALLLTLLFMYISVTILSASFIIARIVVSGIVGVLTYLLNLYTNFKVAGNHNRTKLSH